MKTIILNGSPRPKGNTRTILNELTKYLKGEVKEIQAYHSHIQPCNDCRQCWSNNHCTLEDKMSEIYDWMNVADNFILASPLYFLGLTGELMNILSRFQFYYARKYIAKKEIPLKKKNGVLILTGGGKGTFKGGESTANIIFELTNTNYIDHIFALETHIHPAHEDFKALKKAYLAAEKLNDFFYNL